MQNIDFEDGLKSFTCNNDPSKVIRFNPGDFSIIERIDASYKVIEAVTEKAKNFKLKPDGSPVSDLAEAAEAVREISTAIKEQIDAIFDSQVSEVVFGNQSPMSMVKGVPFYERFLMAVMPVIRDEVRKEKAASKKRIEKYTKQVIK